MHDVLALQNEEEKPRLAMPESQGPALGPTCSSQPRPSPSSPSPCPSPWGAGCPHTCLFPWLSAWKRQLPFLAMSSLAIYGCQQTLQLCFQNKFEGRSLQDWGRHETISGALSSLMDAAAVPRTHMETLPEPDALHS